MQIQHEGTQDDRTFGDISDEALNSRLQEIHQSGVERENQEEQQKREQQHEHDYLVLKAQNIANTSIVLQKELINSLIKNSNRRAHETDQKIIESWDDNIKQVTTNRKGDDRYRETLTYEQYIGMYAKYENNDNLKEFVERHTEVQMPRDFNFAANPLFNQQPQSPPATPYNGNTNPLEGTNSSRPNTSEGWRGFIYEVPDESKASPKQVDVDDPFSKSYGHFSPRAQNSFTSDSSTSSSLDDSPYPHTPSTSLSPPPPPQNTITASKGWEAIKKRIALDLDTKIKSDPGIKSDISAMNERLEQYDVASLSKFIVEKHIAARQAFRRTLA